MATSGNISVNATYTTSGKVADIVKFSWWRNSYSIEDNTTAIGWKLELIALANGYISSSATKTWKVTVNGIQESGTNTIGISSNSTKTLASGTTTIPHNVDGTKTFSFSFSQQFDINFNGSVGTITGSGSGTLDDIPRYAYISKFTVSKRDETSLTVTWDADVACDKVYYSVNNGGWVEGVGYPNFAITGLKANTSYNVKIRVRRKDSQLTTDSDTKSQTTYNYPHCNSASNFTIGDKLTLGFYNPLGRTISVYLILNDGSEKGGDTISGTSLQGYNGTEWQNWLYGSIPNAQSGKYKVKVIYGSLTFTYDKGNTYQIKRTEIPVVNGITYKDIDSAVVAITGNNQDIVQNQSSLQVTFTKATPTYSAGSIKKYTFVLNGVTKESTSAGGNINFGKVNSANDLTLTVTVTDSRGMSASREFEIPMVAHSNPTATVNLTRLNNYEDETYLTVDASISSVNGKNSMAVEYRYKLATDEYSPFVTIPNKEKQTLSLDKNSIFVFNVVVTDAFGTKFEGEYILYKGVFPLFIDTEKNAVGINEFPAEGEALRVAGGISNFVDGVKISGEAVGDFIVEQGIIDEWTYRKWNSGNVDMECMAYRESNVANSLVELTLPLPFPVSKVKPYVTCLASGWAMSRPPYFNIYGGNNSSDNCEELKLYYTADNNTARTYYFAIQVKGTWR